MCIYPLSEKLQSIKSLPVPNKPKKVRLMLGFTGCYWKFIPVYADFVWPLMQLTCKTVPFVWLSLCQKASETLKTLLWRALSWFHPDANKPYTLLMDALKYAWSAVLPEEHATITDNYTLIHQHPFPYVNGLFQVIQLYWTVLTKVAYARYLVVSI